MIVENRPNHGFRRHLDGQVKRSEITVFVWESDGKQLIPKLNSTLIVNRNTETPGGRLHSPSLKDAAWPKDAQSIFLIFLTSVCKFGWVNAVRVKKKKKERKKERKKRNKCMGN